MAKTLWCRTIAFLVLLANGLPLAKASPNADALEEAIVKEHILPAETKLKCSIQGNELLTTTYKVENSTEKDCKINAVLIAKACFAKSPELVRSVVRFYGIRDASSYTEIPVTVADVSAYASGSINMDQLLAAIKTSTVRVQSVVASGKNPAVPVANVPDANAAKKTEQADANTNLYAGYGVSFRYPKAWLAEYPHDGNALVRFRIASSSGVDSNIEIQVFDARSMSSASAVKSDPRDVFSTLRDRVWMQLAPTLAKLSIEQWHNEDRAAYAEYKSHGDLEGYKRWKFSRRNQGSTLFPISIPATLEIGAGKSVRSLQKSFYIQEAGIGARHYCRFVCFGSANYTILLGVFCPEVNAPQANVDFDKLLNTVKAVSTGSATASHAKSGTKK